jgi:Uma2 family endonuclease
MGLPLKKISALEIYEAENFLQPDVLARFSAQGGWGNFTAEEYLTFERNAVDRHEFLDGYVFTMAGESIAHSRICVNLMTEIGLQLRGTRCEALSPNMKVRSISKSMFAYPDLTIVCGEPQFHDTQQDVLINPTVIFEVLSPSTESYDRGDKFRRYRFGCETLTDYVLVSQHIVLVEWFHRQSDGTWLYQSFDELNDILPLGSAGVALRLEDIYRRVGLSSPDKD